MHLVLQSQTAGTIFSLWACLVQLLGHAGCWSYSRFNNQFEHISGKKNVVADTICSLRTLGLYQDNGNANLPKTYDDIIYDIVEEVHDIEWIPNSAAYKMEKLNLDILREAQWQDTFCNQKG